MINIKCVYQRNMMDCGAACLLSIIRLYGGDNTFENVRKICKCSNNGISALNLVKAGNYFGFDVNGYKYNYDDLKHITLPSIAHVVLENGYNHYIVIRDVYDKYIYVFDPAIGNKKITKDEFINIWDNVILEFNKNRDLDVVKENYNSILKVISSNKKLYFKIFITTFISIFLVIINNYYFKLLIDSNNLILVLIFFSITVLIKEITDFIKNKLLIKLENNIDNYLYLNTHKNMLLLSNYYFNTRSVGDITTKFNDISYIKELIIKLPLFILVDLLLIVICTIILLRINKILFLVFIFICILYISIILLFDKKIKKLIILNQELNSYNNSILVENIKCISTIKNLNLETYRQNKYKESFNAYISNRTIYENMYNKENIIKNIILFIGINVILFIGIIYVNNEVLSLSDLILFNSIMLYFIDPLQNICSINNIFKNGVNSVKRINEMYMINNKELLDTNNYDIRINNLSFSYDGYNKVLDNINAYINYKDKIIVYGYSGVGKSTLFKLINKTYEVDNDNIYIGNKDINDIKINNIITYVSQDEVLFNDTLYSNIVLNNNKNNLDKVIKITKLDEVMKKRNLKLESIIEEDGSNLSKGEKQKIILSRSLLKNSKIIILDEALSGVSEYDEFEIMSNVLKYYTDCTIIYITHTKTCMKLFNKIIEIKGGHYEIK